MATPRPVSRMFGGYGLFYPLLTLFFCNFSSLMCLSVPALLNISSSVSDNFANISWIPGREHKDSELYIAYMNNRKLTLLLHPFYNHITCSLEAIMNSLVLACNDTCSLTRAHVCVCVLSVCVRLVPSLHNTHMYMCAHEY